MKLRGSNDLQSLRAGRPRWKRAADFGIYVLVGSALVSVILLTAVYAPDACWADHRFWRIVINTALPFGYSLYLVRRHWGGILFWTVWVAMLTIHLAIYVWVTKLVGDWPTFYSTVASIVEIGFVYVVLQRTAALRKVRKRHSIP